MLAQLKDPVIWEQYYAYKVQSGNLSQTKSQALRTFIDQAGYLSVVAAMESGEPFPPPVKRQISKIASSKKRTVYIFPPAHQYVLKLLTYLLIRKFDNSFTPNLYSFRTSRGVKTALYYLTGLADVDRRYGYKVDVSNYFNSVDVEQLLPMLQGILTEEVEIYRFLSGLLRDRRVRWNTETIQEDKGIMAGCPTAAFLANVYLRELDQQFMLRGIPYARYSDDIILFARNPQEREAAVGTITEVLARLHLTVNREKEYYFAPGERWEFLGLCYQDGIVDISRISAAKLKGKMRRKADALLRWKRKKKLSNEKAAKAFVRTFNRKLYDNPLDSEITWARWYFPMITTTATLKELDRYMQQCIRYIITEKRTKKQFDCTYEQIKALGYRSLVHEYYQYEQDETT